MHTPGPTPNLVCLCYDLLERILEICRDDYNLLFQCSLVNWEFNRAASKKLYALVVVSPPFRPGLDLRDTGSIPKSSNFISACLPRYAPLVLSLRISGHLSTRPPPRNTLPAKLKEGLNVFVNLCSVQYTPRSCHQNLFTECLALLPTLPSLNQLIVNPSCTDEPRAPLVIQIQDLRKLSLYNPGRAILQALPDWLARLSRTLEELHLKDNCGSITPGVLKSFVPHVQDGLTALTLGLSYSLTNEDVFTFLGQLPRLNRLHLRYYWQVKYPEQRPKLLNLRSFTVLHAPMGTRNETDALCKWIRRTIRASPIQELRIICDDDEDYGRHSGPYFSFDGLVDHVVQKHALTIRTLDLGPEALVGNRGIEGILTSCSRLERLACCVTIDGLNVFTDHYSRSNLLQSSSFRVGNTQRRFRPDQEMVRGIMSHGPASFRRLSLNGEPWESFWVVDETKNTTLIIRRVDPLIAPWDKKE